MDYRDPLAFPSIPTAPQPGAIDRPRRWDFICWDCGRLSCIEGLAALPDPLRCDWCHLSAVYHLAVQMGEDGRHDQRKSP